jgi:hypothetical protein
VADRKDPVKTGGAAVCKSSGALSTEPDAAFPLPVMRFPLPVKQGGTPFGIDLAVGAVVAMISVAAAGALAPGAAGRAAVVALGVGGFLAVADDARAGLLAMVLGALLYDGFLVNRFGELSWTGTTSMWHLLSFALVALVALGWRWARGSHLPGHKKEAHGA